LPDGTRLSPSQPLASNCHATDTDAATVINCVIPTIAAGETRTGQLVLETDPTLSGLLANTIVAGAQALDRNDAGNTSTAEGLVEAPTPPTTPTTTPPETTPSPPPDATPAAASPEVVTPAPSTIDAALPRTGGSLGPALWGVLAIVAGVGILCGRRWLPSPRHGVRSSR